MNAKMCELKNVLKEKAIELREKKIETKNFQRKHNGWCNGQQWTIQRLKNEYRHYHIAYSEMRGRSRDEIESNVVRANDTFQLNEQRIDDIKEQYHEDVCVDS